MQTSSEYVLLAVLVNCVAASAAADTNFYDGNVSIDGRYPTIQPELAKIFQNCRRNSSSFDYCMRNAFNDLRAYFKSGTSKDWNDAIRFGYMK